MLERGFSLPAVVQDDNRTRMQQPCEPRCPALHRLPVRAILVLNPKETDRLAQRRRRPARRLGSHLSPDQRARHDARVAGGEAQARRPAHRQVRKETDRETLPTGTHTRNHRPGNHRCGFLRARADAHTPGAGCPTDRRYRPHRTGRGRPFGHNPGRSFAHPGPHTSSFCHSHTLTFSNRYPPADPHSYTKAHANPDAASPGPGGHAGPTARRRDHGGERQPGGGAGALGKRSARSGGLLS